MWICLNCGRTFEDPIHWEERHGFSHGPFEHFSGSPCCSDDYAEAYKCGCCDKWITGTYVKTESGERICENCYITYEIGEE